MTTAYFWLYRVVLEYCRLTSKVFNTLVPERCSSNLSVKILPRFYQKVDSGSVDVANLRVYISTSSWGNLRVAVFGHTFEHQQGSRIGIQPQLYVATSPAAPLMTL